MIVFAKLFSFFAASTCNSGSFFAIPHWWEYIPAKNINPVDCSITFPKGGIVNGIFPIGLAVLDIMLYVAGLVAVFAVIYGGISYMTATGNAEKVTSARRAIVNALVGLGIVLVAAQIVSFIGGHIK
jgi:hypothetical protein